jgi:UDP-N-acetylmuramyl pentapeptide phosphotransferase/UDP-N-acetylglucosamine-1-phosphate transferase
MEMQETFRQLNWWAILVAAVSTFLIGGIWYSLFEKQWIAINNFTKEYLSKRKLPLVFGLSFLFAFIMSFNLAMFLGPKADISFGIIAGFLTGFGWIFFSIGIIALFEKRSFKYVLINGGYMVIAFIIMGAILGSWH